jgi:hypothetical protein
MIARIPVPPSLIANCDHSVELFFAAERLQKIAFFFLLLFLFGEAKRKSRATWVGPNALSYTG